MPEKNGRSADSPTLSQLLALSDAELEKADVVLLNLAVAREIPALADLDVGRYVRIVDEWTRQFARLLPGMEATFRKTPKRWQDDIRFFRVGMLQGFLGHEIGIRYIEEQKKATAVRYTNPGDLFLNGLIDRRQGTCGNMATLHVAIARRMGWPVSLACAKSHLISRFDDGQAVYNIEATSTHPGSFASDPDEVYVEQYSLPDKAIECGSDLGKLTAREMAGVFLSQRGRHYCDVGNMDQADLSYAMSRVLFPQSRCAYIGGIVPMIRRGAELFDRGELGHPDSLFECLAPHLAPGVFQPLGGHAMASDLPSTVSLITSFPSQVSLSPVVMDRVHSDLQRE